MSLYDFTNELKTNPNAGQGSGDGFDNSPLPAGDYDFVITGAEEKPYCAKVKGMKTENIALYLAENPEVQAGKKAVIKAKVLNGPSKDREVWWFFTIIPASDAGVNKSGKTVEQQLEIDKSKILGLIKRCQCGPISALKDLLGCTLRLKVTVWQGGSSASNNFGFWVKEGEVIQKVGVEVGTAPVKDMDGCPF
jgi:hypothetical protein